ncbi:creatininase family protein [Chloroflexi bacterium TSY]|nr:creatininase family protein [Chloroflexi bacterium TSY]
MTSIMTKPTRHFAHMTWTEIEALDKQQGVVILPIGSVEQHGPHLPVLTDSLIATNLTEAMLARLHAEVQAWALPPLNYGKSNEHINFPGTVTLSASTLSVVLHDIGQSIHRADFRRLAFLNGHGGNVAVLEAAAALLEFRW